MRVLTGEEQVKLKKLVENGVSMLTEIQELKQELTDSVKAIAAELDFKPAFLNKVISAKFKQDLVEKKTELDDVDELLELIK